MEKFTFTIHNFENDNMIEDGVGEVTRLLQQAASEVEKRGFVNQILRDTNGNIVGSVIVNETERTSTVFTVPNKSSLIQELGKILRSAGYHTNCKEVVYPKLMLSGTTQEVWKLYSDDVLIATKSDTDLDKVTEVYQTDIDKEKLFENFSELLRIPHICVLDTNINDMNKSLANFQMKLVILDKKIDGKVAFRIEFPVNN